MSEYRQRRRRRRQVPAKSRDLDRITVILGEETGEAEESTALPVSPHVEGRLVRSAPEAQRAYPARDMTRLEPGS